MLTTENQNETNSMKKITMSAIVGIAWLMAGCFPTSINPLYTEPDLVFEPALAGVWRGDAEGDAAKETWAFEKAGDKAYKLVHTDKDGRTGQFEVYRLRLSDTFFLDFFPAVGVDQETNRNEVYQFHFVPVHSFAKVSRTDSALQLSFLSLEWLGRLLEKNPQAIRHEMVGPTNEQRCVLTASTKELQKFVRQHLDNKEAFLDPIKLKRTQPSR